MADFKNLEIIAGGDQSNRFTPKELLVKYLAFLPLFIISIILCLAIATIYTRYITPKYVANTLMYIKEEKGSGGQGDVLEKAILNTDKNYDAYGVSEKSAPIDAYYHLATCYHQIQEIDQELFRGAEKAASIANGVLKRVRQKLGFSF